MSPRRPVCNKVMENGDSLGSALFLPLYFALSGRSTNLGLLDNGVTWGYVFGVIVVAFCSTFAGGTLAAKVNNLVWRESFTIGSYLAKVCQTLRSQLGRNCMLIAIGLVELTVLNIGL